MNTHIAAQLIERHIATHYANGDADTAEALSQLADDLQLTISMDSVNRFIRKERDEQQRAAGNLDRFLCSLRRGACDAEGVTVVAERGA